MVFAKKINTFRYKRKQGCYEDFHKIMMFVIQTFVMQ